MSSRRPQRLIKTLNSDGQLVRGDRPAVMRLSLMPIGHAELVLTAQEPDPARFNWLVVDSAPKSEEPAVADMGAILTLSKSLREPVSELALGVSRWPAREQAPTLSGRAQSAMADIRELMDAATVTRSDVTVMRAAEFLGQLDVLRDGDEIYLQVAANSNAGPNVPAGFKLSRSSLVHRPASCVTDIRNVARNCGVHVYDVDAAVTRLRVVALGTRI